MGPQRFGWEHLVYLATFVVICVPGFICAKKYAKSEKSQTIILKSLAVLLLGCIIFNRLSLVFKYDEPRWIALIPDSICGLDSLFLSLVVLFGKKDNPALHFLWHISLVGGALTSIAPSFIGQNPSFLYLPTISGLLHHTMSVVVVIALLLFNQVHITYKKWRYTVTGIGIYIAIGAFLITFVGLDDAVNMRSPLVGNLTVWPLLPVYAVGYTIVLSVIELVRKKIAKKSNA